MLALQEIFGKIFYEMKRTPISPAKVGAMTMEQQRCKRRAGLDIRANLEPVFRFNDGMFVYRLNHQLRAMLNVDEDNPGVVVIIE